MANAIPLARSRRYRVITERAAVELIPTERPDAWHLAVFRDGYLKASHEPKAAAMVPTLLDALEVEISDGEHTPSPSYQHNPYRSVERTGYVYYFDVEGTDFVKIGTSVNVRSRFLAIQQHMPFKLHIRFTCSGGPALEATLHQRFAQHCQRGEWFRKAPEVMAFTEEIQDARELYRILALPWKIRPAKTVMDEIDDAVDELAVLAADPWTSTGSVGRACSRQSPRPLARKR